MKDIEKLLLQNIFEEEESKLNKHYNVKLIM